MGSRTQSTYSGRQTRPRLRRYSAVSPEFHLPIPPRRYTAGAETEAIATMLFSFWPSLFQKG
jgi:hypothetical protein